MGLNISTYRHGKHEGTNGGLSATHDQLCVVNVEGPFNPTDDAPAVLLDTKPKAGTQPYARLIPAIQDEYGRWVPDRPAGTVGPMFGGNYAATSDGRFGAAVGFYGAVAIHDRFETPEQYEALSR